MFDLFNRFVISIALLRFMSGIIEITAGMFMLKINDLHKTLMINSSLAVVGPFIFIMTTSIGLFGIADRLSFTKLLFIFIGVVFIFVGLKK